MTAHDLLTCASRKTESMNEARGLSVSRRSKRFGEHPCADLLPVYWKVFSSIQFRGCCASGISSPASIAIGCELAFVDDRLFGSRLFRSLSREVERLPQSETPSLDKKRKLDCSTYADCDCLA
jgi:hypothetical protein